MHFPPFVQDVLEGPLRIIARHRIPILSEMKDIGLIPNATDGSDHFPLAAEFLLNPWTFTRWWTIIKGRRLWKVYLIGLTVMISITFSSRGHFKIQRDHINKIFSPTAFVTKSWVTRGNQLTSRNILYLNVGAPMNWGIGNPSWSLWTLYEIVSGFLE